MKICSLYGAGFYYIPGTDMCFKIGGYLRAELDANAGGSFTPFINGANAQFFRGGDSATTRARGTMTFDAREQTEYGTIRSYLWGGWNYTSNDAPTLSLPGTSVGSAGGAAGIGNNSNAFLLRAFVQFGGFVFGKAASTFDFFDTGRYTHQTNYLYQDDGGVGINQIAYTQQWGNGLSSSIAAEDGTFFSHPVRDLNTALAGTVAGFGSTFPILAAGGPTNSPWNNAGLSVPDLVGTLRVDQAWGSAQIMGGAHDDRARYYQGTANGITAGTTYPADKWGWAAGAGLRLNVPTGKGDTFDLQSTYCQGWSGRCANNNGVFRSDQTFGLVNGGTIGLGWIDDAYMANTAATGATSLQLPKMWNLIAGYQHYWTQAWRTSAYGGYVNYRANSSAVDTLVCAPNGFGNGCADWAAWNVGSRTVWSPSPNLEIGVDVLYTQMSKSAFSGGTTTFAPAGAAANTFTVGPTNVLSAIFRVQRNFVP